MEVEQFVAKEKIHNLEVFMDGLEHESSVPAVDNPQDGEYIEVDYSVLELVSEIKKLQRESAAIDKRIDDLKMELRGCIGSYEYALYGGEILATLKTVYKKEYVVPAKSYRSLLIK